MSRPPVSLDEKAKHLAEGEAALVLMENLLLMLVEKGVLRRDEVVQSIEGLVDMKRQMAEEGASPTLSQVAAGMLVTLANSISAADKPRAAASDGDGRDSGAQPGP